MTTPPPWVPTPEALLPDPATLLGLFLDAPAGNIGADDVRALVQASFSALHWQTAADAVLTQQVTDLAAVVTTLVADLRAAEGDIGRQQGQIGQLVSDNLGFITQIADLDARLVVQEARP